MQKQESGLSATLPRVHRCHLPFTVGTWAGLVYVHNKTVTDRSLQCWLKEFLQSPSISLLTLQQSVLLWKAYCTLSASCCPVPWPMVVICMDRCLCSFFPAVMTSDLFQITHITFQCLIKIGDAKWMMQYNNVYQCIQCIGAASFNQVTDSFSHFLYKAFGSGPWKVIHPILMFLDISSLAKTPF